MMALVMTLVSGAVFTGAMGLALAAIWSTLAPEWRRITRLAAGHIEQPFQPLADLAQAEHRIAVRRWAAAPMPTMLPAPIRQLRAAA